MTGYHVFKLIHLIAVFALFLAFGAVMTAEKSSRSLWPSLLHGIALLVILLAGFAMLHSLGIGARGALPPWVIGKLVIWLLLGLSLAPAKRKLLSKPALALLLLVLGGGACALALWKPI